MEKRGFTLIELLVVIAIIGILSGVVLASLNTARLKARNAQRISDTRQVMLALEFFFDDQRRKGMVHVVVDEKNMIQHLWVTIGYCQRGWCISKAEGQPIIPTEGVAHALDLIYQQAKQTVSDTA